MISQPTSTVTRPAGPAAVRCTCATSLGVGPSTWHSESCDLSITASSPDLPGKILAGGARVVANERVSPSPSLLWAVSFEQDGHGWIRFYGPDTTFQLAAQ